MGQKSNDIYMDMSERSILGGIDRYRGPPRVAALQRSGKECPCGHTKRSQMSAWVPWSPDGLICEHLVAADAWMG